jgi:type IV pilus assembly protein PilC
MTTYSYTAFNQAGRKTKGVVIADNELDLEARLKHMGLDLIDSKATRERKSSRFSTIRLRDLIVLCLHLEQLARAGVPLHDALADVRDASESMKLRDVLSGVYESVKNGKELSKAFAEHPRVFSPVFVGLVAAGEKTGNLPDSFSHLSEHLKWMSDIRRKLRKATAYPLVLLCVLAVVISVLMLFVVPKLIDFIMAQGFSLPWHTRALIAVSNGFQEYWYMILGLPFGIVLLFSFLYRTSEKFAYQTDWMLLRLPLIGPCLRKIDMARFTHFFAIMFNSGIDMLESLEAAKNVVGNRVLKEAVGMVKTDVTEGNSLASSLRISNQFPNLVIRMFKVGEDSGNMTEALDNVNFFYNREVSDSVDAMLGAIQPILTVVMGVLVFWVIAAVFGPLYESFSKIKF